MKINLICDETGYEFASTVQMSPRVVMNVSSAWCESDTCYVSYALISGSETLQITPVCTVRGQPIDVFNRETGEFDYNSLADMTFSFDTLEEISARYKFLKQLSRVNRIILNPINLDDIYVKND